MAAAESEENKKWFINRIDSVIQNVIDVEESDYDTFSSMVRDSDDELLRARNLAWQIIAVIAATGIALTQLFSSSHLLLFDALVILLLLGVAWTLIIAFIRGVVLPRMERVDDAYLAARLSMLYLQSWFQNNTMTVSTVSQEKLDLYFDFVKVAVAALYSSVLSNTIQYQAEMRLLKPGQQLNPELQRLTGTEKEGYEVFKAKRNGLMNPVVFSPTLREMLTPFENEYQKELKEA